MKRQTIIDTHHLARQTAYHFPVRRQLLLLRHGRAFIGLKMAEPNPAQGLRIDE